MRRFSMKGFMLLIIAAMLLPAAMAGAQSPYLESVDLLYRNYAMATANAENRLADDFLDTMMRLDAGVLELDTVTGAWAAEAAGPPEGEANGFYVAAYTGGIELDGAAIGYDADISGMMVGYQRWMGNTLVALNLASTEAEADFTGTGFTADSEDQEMTSGAIHAMGLYYDNWTWRARVGGFVTDHDYDGVTGGTISETAEYETYGINASAMIGRLIRLGETWGTLLPEIGGEYLYTERASFASEAAVSSWNMETDRFHDNQLLGAASLRWAARLSLGDIDVTPSVALGFQKLFSDEMIAETQTVGNVDTFFQNEQEEVTKTLSASVLVHLPANFQATLSYDGGYGDDADQHLLALRCRFSF